jgi:hypothetical protein
MGSAESSSASLRHCSIVRGIKLFIALHGSGISHNGIIICKTDRDYVGQAQTLHAYLQEELNKILWKRFAIAWFA